MSVVDKFTLKSFIVVSAWLSLLLFIAYGCYKYPELVKENFSNAFSVALAILNIAIGGWLFEKIAK
ncbi:MAG: hypothetical protein QW540_08190 [Archaeoglobaceae archaeon]